MIDLDNPSLLVMTEFELIATVAAFSAVLGMAVLDLLKRRGARPERTGTEGEK